MEDLVIGNPECSFESVWEIIISNDAEFSIQKWEEFATLLKVPKKWIEWNITRVFIQIVTLKYAIKETLELWQRQEGQQATLKRLVNILKQLKLGKIAENLEIKFMRSSNIHVQCSSYQTMWSNLSMQLQADILKRQIKFRGSLITLETFCVNFGLSLDKIVKGPTLSHFISENEVCFLNAQIPPKPSYYTQRKLVGRNNVDTSVLKETCDDIFLFVGIERHKLRRLIPDNSLTSTTQEYLQSSQREHTFKFMTLDLKTDFGIIVSTTVYPVHLFEYTGTHLKWIQSARSIEVVLRHISIHQSYFDEEDFVKNLSVKCPVVLSDLPGSGKSYLLQNIARQLERKHHDRIVILLKVSEFANNLDQISSSDKMMLKWLTTNCQNPFEVSAIENMMLSSNTKIYLLLDGFDEIEAKKIEQVTRQLIETKRFPSISVWITTRPQHLNHLESIFQVTGYNICSDGSGYSNTFQGRIQNQCKKSSQIPKLKDFGRESIRVRNEQWVVNNVSKQRF